MEGLTGALVEGRVVHYVIQESDIPESHAANKTWLVGRHRAAMVSQVFEPHNAAVMANLMVLFDGANDGYPGRPWQWRTSVHYSEKKEPGTWHWTER